MTDKTRQNLKKISLFLFHLLCGGFFLGTLTLMGPARWAASHARASGWPDAGERAALLLIMAALAAASLLLARYLTGRTLAAAGSTAKAALAAGPLAAAGLALWFWLNPALMINKDAPEARLDSADVQFVLGPYPEAARFAELRAENYSAVISLLSPAVVPFEPVLLEREKAAAAAAGMELIHIPMLPWVSSNDHARAELARIAARGPGKYYVHCYLGKDRVNVFRRFISETVANASQAQLQPGSARNISDVKTFERGAITRLEKGVFFTPYPTDEEFFAYLLNGGAATLVSLLDPANPENLPWIKKEKEISAKYRLPLVSHPWTSLDPAARKRAVREIRALKRPVVVHAFLSAAPESADFIRAYNSEKGAFSSLLGD